MTTTATRPRPKSAPKMDAPLLDARIQRLTDDCREVFELTLRHEDGSRVCNGERSNLLRLYAGLLLRLAVRGEEKTR